jgi:hypothetical protein
LGTLLLLALLGFASELIASALHLEAEDETDDHPDDLIHRLQDRILHHEGWERLMPVAQKKHGVVRLAVRLSPQRIDRAPDQCAQRTGHWPVSLIGTHLFPFSAVIGFQYVTVVFAIL